MIELAFRKQLGHIPYQFELNVEGSIPLGTTLGIWGDSGAGKSTLMRIMAGLDRGAKGYMRVEGRILQHTEQKRFMQPQHRGLSFLMQDPILIPHLTILQNLHFALGQKSSEEVPLLVEGLGLEEILGQKPATLSVGQTQRVAIAQVLLRDQPILLLDEPFSAQDQAMRQKIIAILKERQKSRGLTYVMVSHQKEDMLEMAEGLWILVNGNLAQQGSPLTVWGPSDIPALPAKILNIHDENPRMATILVGQEIISIPLLPSMGENAWLKGQEVSLQLKEGTYTLLPRKT